MHVLDGGALLHRVKWGKKMSYQEVAKAVCVKKVCADTQLSETTEAYKNQEVFLTDEKNKHQFILLINQYLKDDGQVVHQSTGDADMMIVQCALQYAIEGSESQCCC